MENLKEERRFYQNPGAAFQSGFYVKKKVKRIADTYYLKYHFFLPSHLMPTIKFLKTYFQRLDHPLSAKCYRRRTSSLEYAETAADVLFDIYRRLELSDSILAGSKAICALPWAVFGKKERLAKNIFPTMGSIFHFYERFVGSNGFNIVSVLYRQDRNFNKIVYLSNEYKISANLVLAVAIMLLSDLIRNCGPDANEFMQLFSNDVRDRMSDIVARWKQIRSELINPGEPKDLKEALGCHFPVKSSYNNNVVSSYSDVSITDYGVSSALLGEKTLLFDRSTQVIDYAASAESEIDKTPPWLDDDDCEYVAEKYLAWLGQKGYDY